MTFDVKKKKDQKKKKNSPDLSFDHVPVILDLHFYKTETFNFKVRNPNILKREENNENDLIFVYSQGAYKSSTICYSPEKGTWTELEGEVAEPLAGPACSTVILPVCLPFNK